MNERTARRLESEWKLCSETTTAETVEEWTRGGPEPDAEPIVLPANVGEISGASARIAVIHSFEFNPLSDSTATLALSLCGDCGVVLNGRRIWSNTNAVLPAQPHSIADALEPGENRIAIFIARSQDTSLPAGIASIPEIQSCPAFGIQDVYIQPDIRRHRVTVTVSSDDAGEIRCRVEDGEEHTFETNSPYHLDLPNYKCWPTTTEALYSLHASLIRGDKVVDETSTQFAMREFGAKDQKLTLNNKSKFVKVLRQHTGDVFVFDSPENRTRIKIYFSRLVAAGFDAVQLKSSALGSHVADAAAIAGMPLIITLGIADAETSVTNLRNESSIVAWHLPDTHEDLIASVRTIDPSRLIFVADPDSALPHTFIRPYRDDRTDATTVSFAADFPCSPAALRYLRNFGDGNRPNVLHVGFSWPDAINDDAAIAVAGARLHDLLANTRINPRTAVCILDAPSLSDTDAALPEPMLKAAEFANAPIHPVIEIRRPNLCLRQDVDVVVHLINEAKFDGRVDMSLMVIGPTNQVLWKKKRGIRVPKHGRELWSGSVAASGSSGPHRFVVRLMAPTGVIAEASAEFFVYEKSKSADAPVDIVDPNSERIPLLESLGYRIEPSAPVILIPPLARTVRAYPDNALAQALGRAQSGAVAVIFSPPEDWNELAERVSPSLEFERSELAFDKYIYRRVPEVHPAFDGLPVDGPLGATYGFTLTDAAFEGETEESIVDLQADDKTLRGILVRRYGDGRLVFVQMDPLRTLERDPIAQRMLKNIVTYFSRRALPSESPIPIARDAVEWLRSQRSRVQRWHVIGPFANWDGDGHDTAYPPELERNLNATYPGWFSAATWDATHCVADIGEVRLNLAEFGCRTYRMKAEGVHGTYYAYSECFTEQRTPATLSVDTGDNLRVWVNGNEVLIAKDSLESLHQTSLTLRQGRNAILVKVSARGSAGLVAVSVIQEDENHVIRWSV